MIRPYVACNIYVSAGSEVGHAPILLDLLRKAQLACRPRECVVVKAFADRAYNRSSFHLAGRADHLSKVAAQLAKHALESIRVFSSNKAATSEQLHHPFVGFVDHVSIMPIEGIDNADQNQGSTAFQPSTPSGMAADHVGSVLEEAGVLVYYYGNAHPQGMPLAHVRKEKTQFFKSGGLAEAASLSQHQDVATVGAPLEFVENYNIRLSAACPKKTAYSLTRSVRERDGGLSGVEALTLPYSEGRWEVACNLLHPQLASTRDIDRIVQDWAKDGRQGLVETSYRVGTTAEQCRQAILSLDQAALNTHNQKVRADLASYLDGSMDGSSEC